MDDLSLPGCFGMTELGHGSNVMGIEVGWGLLGYWGEGGDERGEMAVHGRPVTHKLQCLVMGSSVLEVLE